MTDLARAQAHIADLHARYTDAVWRQDADAFADCFTPDAEWRISGRVFAGREAIREGIAAILSRFVRVLISFRAPIVTFDGDEACARTYVDERCAWKNGERNISIGRYYERFRECDDGRWRFRWRLFELHYRGDADLGGTFFDLPDHGPPPAMPPLDATTEDVATQRWGI